MNESALRAPALRVALALGTVYVVWGSTYLAIRVAIESMTPFLMAAARFLIAGAVLYAWARWRGAPRPQPAQWRSSALIGAALLLAGKGGVVWAEQHMSSGLTALLISTEPLWIVLLAWALTGGRRPSPRVLAGMALGFGGLVLLLRPSSGAAVSFAGAAVVLIASACWAAGSLYSLRATLPRSPALATAMQMLCGGGLLLVAAVVAGEPGRFELARVSGRSLAAFVYLIVFGALVGYTAYVWLLRSAPPVLVSTYAYVNPVVAVLLGWAVAHEAISRGTLVAAAVIVAGVALIASAPAPTAPPAQTPAVPREEPAPETPARPERDLATSSP